MPPIVAQGIFPFNPIEPSAASFQPCLLMANNPNRFEPQGGVNAEHVVIFEEADLAEYDVRLLHGFACGELCSVKHSMSFLSCNASVSR
ncbi:hypothetical protein [Candidatus Villigracilis affinis]|uniref:hypothetical protein n=1 Tax=Candidatus Villigracilis affinis TaxID=3140682 RepID=UPI002A198384|nr:hypothetical protein [Anaerolineales bacterium]